MGKSIKIKGVKPEQSVNSLGAVPRGFLVKPSPKLKKKRQRAKDILKDLSDLIAGMGFKDN